MQSIGKWSRSCTSLQVLLLRGKRGPKVVVVVVSVTSLFCWMWFELPSSTTTAFTVLTQWKMNLWIWFFLPLLLVPCILRNNKNRGILFSKSDENGWFLFGYCSHIDTLSVIKIKEWLFSPLMFLSSLENYIILIQ